MKPKTVFEVGMHVTNFVREDEQGNWVSFDDLLKKSAVLLLFYPKDFSPVCSKQWEAYLKISKKRIPFQIVGVSPDSSESHLKFRKEKKLPFLLLSDPKKTLFYQYGIYSKWWFGKPTRGFCLILPSHLLAWKQVEKTPVTYLPPQALLKALKNITKKKD